MITKSKKKGRYRSLFFPLFIIILTVGVIGSLIVSNLRIDKKRSELMARIESLKKEIQTLETKKTELQSGVNMSQSEENLEEAAREQFGLKKPGEEVVVVKQEQKEEVKKEEKKSFWERIWEKINPRD